MLVVYRGWVTLENLNLQSPVNDVLHSNPMIMYV
jgi:hypothetical protein